MWQAIHIALAILIIGFRYISIYELDVLRLLFYIAQVLHLPTTAHLVCQKAEILAAIHITGDILLMSLTGMAG